MIRAVAAVPLNVAALRERAELADAFIEAAVAEGFPRNPDYNNGHQEGFSSTVTRSTPGLAVRRCRRNALSSAATALESGSHRDSPLEEGGFELLVPACIKSRGRYRLGGSETTPHLAQPMTTGNRVMPRGPPQPLAPRVDRR